MLNLNTGLNTTKTSTLEPKKEIEEKKPEDKKQEEVMVAPGSLGASNSDVFVPSTRATDTDNKGISDEGLVEKMPDGNYNPGQINTIEARVVPEVKETLEGKGQEVNERKVQQDVEQATTKVIEQEKSNVDLTRNNVNIISNAALYAKIAEAMIK